MSRRFSDRIGVTQAKTNLLLDEIDEPLWNSLWNFVIQRCFNSRRSAGGSSNYARVTELIAQRHLKLRVDRLPTGPHAALQWLDGVFSQLEWYEIYNLIEFLVNELGNVPWFMSGSKTLQAEVNLILAEELAGYRFIDGLLTPISSAVEVQAIEDALTVAKRAGLDGVQEHIRAALSRLAQRPEPDFRNSVKEAISAVESAARLISGKGGLKEALTELEKHFPLHPAMKAGFLNLYGYTSDDDGIRHAILDAPSVGFDEAKFMLVGCSAFAYYLISKADTAGLLAKRKK